MMAVEEIAKRPKRHRHLGSRRKYDFYLADEADQYIRFLESKLPAGSIARITISSRPPSEREIERGRELAARHGLLAEVAADPMATEGAGKLNQYGLSRSEWTALVGIGCKLHDALMNEPEGEDYYDGQSLSIMTHLVEAFKAARPSSLYKRPPGSSAGIFINPAKYTREEIATKLASGSINQLQAEEMLRENAVPAPVPTEGDGVPPVFNNDRALVEQVSKLPFSRRYAIYRNIKNVVITAPSAPEAAAAGDEMPPWIQFPCPTCHASSGAPCVAIASCMERVLLTTQPAAPIAPAAEELIRELRDKVRELEDALMYATEGEENPSVAYANCIEGGKSLRKTTEYEIARAEEYRKGAKK